MEESEVNMDSFVDIVANTVGMVIILTMLTVVRADKSGILANEDLSRLSELTSAIREDEAQADVLAKQLMAKVGEAHAAGDAARSLASLKAASAKAASKLKQVRRRRDSAGATRKRRTSCLAELRAEKEKYHAAIARAEAGTLYEGLSDADRRSLEGAPLVRLRASAEKLTSEVEALKAGIKEHEDTAKRRAAEAKKIEEANKAVEQEIQSIRERTEVVVEVVPPGEARRPRAALLIECYAAPAPAPPAREAGGEYVRLFDPAAAAYAREGESLRARREGESLATIAGAESAYRKLLAGRGAGVSTESRSLRFIVRPDAYRVFRAARSLALEAGWKVDWEPIEPLD